MKRLLKTLVLTLSLILSFSTVSVFATTNEYSEGLNDYIKSELETFIKQNNLNIELNNINFKLKKSLNKTELDEDINKIKESLLAYRKTTIHEHEIQPYIVDKGSYYTAKVWSGVPSIGHGYINQDFSVNISNGRITSINILGNSYQTGFTLAVWNPNRSWTTLTQNNTHLGIHMKGVLNYTFNIVQGGMDATFVEDVKVSNGKLVPCYTC